MSRPLSVSIASWIWVLCGMFTTVTVASVVTATDILALVAGMGADDSARGGVGANLSGAEPLGWAGWALAIVLFAAMVVQVVAASRLRDGARRSRALLTTAASVSLLVVLYDPTLWSAWVLLVANAVALVFTYDDHALDYLESRPEQLVSV
ncbi:hypothetical protein G6031_17825 [Dietzia sp. CQ4]|uniref:hypothetical protein n=1 Tax=Dietzia sp. (strain CQ4) TaxID=370437 RepID=UPI0015FD9579|nr:hypothetical protein [Dietzia sp. CQ4]MBB1036230.1 hypothetical protein [Dietzia sp. CQ4]